MTSHTKWHVYSTSVGVFVFAFLLTFFASSIFTPISSTNAEENTTDNTSADGYSLTLSTTSLVNLDLVVGPVDVMTVSLGNVNVKTNSPGYKLYIGMTGNTTALNGNGISGSIPATNGTITAPASLTRGTWGYAVPSSTTNLVSNGFSGSYTELSSATPDNTKKFAIPPTATNNPDLLATSATATTSAGDTYPIYYGAMANADTPQGEYTNNVMFTAVADANSTELMELTPDWARISTASTITVKTSLYATTAATADVYLLTNTQNTQVQGGTPVETLGLTPLTCSKTSDTPMTYSCNVPAMSSGTYYIYAKSVRYDKSYTTAFYVKPTLTVDPNGGTWSSSTSTQTFNQMEGTTKTISNPTGQSFTISYNMGSTGITEPTSPTSATKPFNSWSKSGGGSLSGTTYTFGNADGTLTASYNNASISLPSISKAGHDCKWAEGSASGTQYTGGTSRTITANTTYYAVCTAINYTVNISNNNTTSGSNSISVPYGGSTTVTVTPSSGYYLSGVSCPSGYTCSGYNTGTSYTGQQTVTVTNNNATSGGTLTFTGTMAKYMQDQTHIDACKNAATNTSFTLTDSRDGNEYTVKKLKDGKCWMTQNLRLVGPFKPDKTDSDVTWNKTDTNAFELTASNSGTWCTSTSSSCYDQSMVLDSGNNSYGTYYNWYSATAGTGTYSITGSASSSICPKGWRLPTGGDSGEFQSLYNQYNTSANMRDATNGPGFVLSGYRLGSSTRDQDSYGYYWSSTALSSNDAYGLHLGRSYVVPAYNNYKYRGFSARCVAK